MPPKINKMKKKKKSALVPTGLRSTINADQIRVKGYTLIKHKALEKKLAACSIEHIEVIPADLHNFKLQLSTAAFELCRQAVLSCLHLGVEDNPDRRPNRSIEHIRDVDGNGSITSELFRIKNWGSVAKPRYAETLNGPCLICINLYWTTSLILINGADSSKFIDVIAPVLEDKIISNNDKLTQANSLISNAIIASLQDTNISVPNTNHAAPPPGAPAPTPMLHARATAQPISVDLTR